MESKKRSLKIHIPTMWISLVIIIIFIVVTIMLLSKSAKKHNRKMMPAKYGVESTK